MGANNSVSGAMKAVEILRADAFKELGLKLWDIPFPGCENEGEMWSLPYLRCLARHQSYTAWHPCGTCAMGPEGSGVVDHRLRWERIRACYKFVTRPNCTSAGHTA